MKGVELFLNDNQKDVIVKLEPLLLDNALDPKSLYQLINLSDFSEYFFLEQEITNVCDVLDVAIAKDDMAEIQAKVAVAKDAEVTFLIAQDKLSASMTISSPYMGIIPSVQTVIAMAKKQGLVKGVSTKRINKLLEQIKNATSGSVLSDEIAKGLPPRQGKNSRVVPLIPCALDRVLEPKALEDGSVDMRDLGDILCVAKNNPVAERLPPTKGRNGVGVDRTPILAEPGKWLPLKITKNCYICPENENIARSKIAGLPVISPSKIDVDDVFVCRGVNVASGNVKFDGAVIINGDVTEKMRVVARGDVTINGFVESAYIESGGDIVITQGASGKLNQSDCTLIADGSIFIQHGQGLTLNSEFDIIVGKQLAYSEVHSKGNVVVGDIRKPRGKLFASSVFCAKAVMAGHLGAISGSNLTIDYTSRFEELQTKSESLNDLFDDLASKNADHEIKVSNIHNRKPDDSYSEKLASLNKELELERVFLNWLRINKDDYKDRLKAFYDEAKVVATEKIYPGVNVKLHNKSWSAKKEYKACQLVLEGTNWIYQP